MFKHLNLLHYTGYKTCLNQYHIYVHNQTPALQQLAHQMLGLGSVSQFAVRVSGLTGHIRRGKQGFFTHSSRIPCISSHQCDRTAQWKAAIFFLQQLLLSGRHGEFGSLPTPPRSAVLQVFCFQQALRVDGELVCVTQVCQQLSSLR